MYVHFYLEESCYMYNFMCVVTILRVNPGVDPLPGLGEEVREQDACLLANGLLVNK